MISNLKFEHINTNVCIENISVQDIAIIGMDFKIAGADSEKEFWQLLKEGRESIGELSKERQKDVVDYYTHCNISLENFEPAFGGFLKSIDEFDYKYFKITPKEASLMNPAQRMMLESVKNLIEDAGYTDLDMRASSTGVYIGMISDFGIDKYKEMIRNVEDKSLHQLAATGNLASIITGRISYTWDLKGPSVLIDTACSSSLVAIHMACAAIRNKECKQAIVGGINLDMLPLKEDIKIGFESHSNRTRPFSDNADGAVMGEGVVTLLLKPREEAEEDRDNIYGLIMGSAVNQDGYSMGITAPNSKAQEDVICKAWENAGIDPGSITYIEAHGTGTKLGDPIEIEGIKGAFIRYINKKQGCAIGSVKGNIGHLYGAAGIISVVKCLLAIKNRQIPPNINFYFPNSRINLENSPVYVNDRLVKWGEEHENLTCAVSSFGFSGTNCHMVIKNYNYPRTKKDMKKKMLFTLSAESPERMEELLTEYRSYLNENQNVRYQDICYTACVGRTHYPYRSIVTVASLDELMEALSSMQYSHITSCEDSRCQYKDAEIFLSLLDFGTWENSLEEISRAYLSGAEIPWKRLYQRYDVKRVSLPKYHFRNKRCWLNYQSNPGDIVLKILGQEAAPLSEIEVELSKIVVEVLGLTEIDLNQSILDYGGDSIMLTKVYEKIDARYKNIITLPQMFVYSSIKKLSEYIIEKAGNINGKEILKKNDTVIAAVEEELNLDQMFLQLENGETSVENVLEEFLKS